MSEQRDDKWCLTAEKIEAFRKEWNIPGEDLEPWAIDENKVVHAMCDIALASVRSHALQNNALGATVERRAAEPGQPEHRGSTSAASTTPQKPDTDQPATVHGLIDHIADFVQDVTKKLDEKAPGNERVIQALLHVAGCIGVMKLRIPDFALSPLARKCRHGYREENCGLCHPELEPKETPQSGA